MLQWLNLKTTLHSLRVDDDDSIHIWPEKMNPSGAVFIIAVFSIVLHGTVV